MNESILTDEKIKELLLLSTKENYTQFPILTDEELEEAILDSKLEEGGFEVEKLNLKIKEIIAKNTEELKIEDITPNKHLETDLGMDNLDKFQMKYNLEIEFKIAEKTDGSEFETVEDVYLYVKKKILEK